MMTVVEQERHAVAIGSPAPSREPAAFVGSAKAMRELLRPGMGLAIWQRSLEDSLRDELAGLTLDAVDDVMLTSSIEALGGAVAQAMDAAGYPAAPRLRDDIVLLARAHAAVTGDPEISLRLEVVETDACRRFHADYVTARTIVTYVGQGTQWIESGCAEAAGAPGGPPIHQLRTGSVAMFKGRIWQETPAVLHRSPPIGGSGEQRLVLVIDAAPERDASVYSGVISQ